MINPFDAAGEFYVVVNNDGDYAIWPAWLELPAGWSAVGGGRPRAECLELIERVWPGVALGRAADGGDAAPAARA